MENIIVIRSEEFEVTNIHSHKNSIYNFLASLGQRFDVQSFRDRKFGRSDLYKEEFGNTRLIYQYIEHNNFVILYIRKVFVRNDKTYNDINSSDKALEYLEKNSIPEEDWDKINAAIDELLQGPPPLPPLSDDLLLWNQLTYNLNSESIFYETKAWTISLQSAKSSLRYVPEILLKIEEAKIDSNWESPINNNIKLVGDDKLKLYVLYEQLTAEKRVVYLLYSIFTEVPTDDDLSIIVNSINPTPNIDFHKKAIKAYPSWLICDEDYWTDLVNDDDANIALSPEQEGLLRDFSLPLFVNGQAGSGKSTMLYYLFAEFCSYYLKNSAFVQGKPLYLTYNPKLLNIAKDAVINILTKNTKYLEESNVNKIEEIKDLFLPFRDLIVEYLLSEEQKSFVIENMEKRIDFNAFSKLYQDYKGKNKNRYSAELIWYVIRTYIKGYDAYKLLEPDGYKNINQKDHILSDEMYKDVYEIFNQFYLKKTDEESYWDEQDLVRWALDVIDEIDKDFPVIFCDESQDFTRIEIELLLKLSTFTKFDLSNCEGVPFAFAGDPYQTINPTGFRWENLTAAFKEKFSSFGAYGLQLDQKELLNNYRCSPAIIRIANYIQYIRYKYLGYTDLHPQSEYRIQGSEGVRPQLFFLENFENEQDALTKDDFVELSETIFLVPLDTRDGVRWKDLETKNIFSFLELFKVEGNMVLPNLDTAASAKGLEHEKIIIFGFGDLAPESLSKLFEEKNLSESEQFELYHFFNKLYVAITRAKESLYIFDTKNGYEKLWKYFIEKDVLQILTEKWSEVLINKSYLEIGKRSEISEIPEKQPLKNAERLYKAGLLEEDPNKMYRAAFFYEKDGSPDNAKKARECIAHYYKFEKKYKEAGDEFIKLNKQEEAFDAYWTGACFEEIISHFDARKTVEVSIAKFSVNGGDDLLLSIASNFANIISSIHIKPDPFKKFVRAISEKADLSKVSITHKRALVVLMSGLIDSGFIEIAKMTGDVHNELKDSVNAIKYWKIAGIDTAEVALLSSDLEPIITKKLQLLQRFISEEVVKEKIFRIWQEHGNEEWSKELQKIVFDLLVQQSTPIDIFYNRKIKDNYRIEWFLENEDLCSTSKIQRSLLLEILKNNEYHKFFENENVKYWLVEYLHEYIDNIIEGKYKKDWNHFVEGLSFLPEISKEAIIRQLATSIHLNRKRFTASNFDKLSNHNKTILIDITNKTYNALSKIDLPTFNDFDDLLFFLKASKDEVVFPFYRYVITYADEKAAKEAQSRLISRGGETSNILRNYRLVKAATKLNVSTKMIAEFLRDNGFEIIDKPTTIITTEMFDLLEKKFVKIKEIKESQGYTDLSKDLEVLQEKDKKPKNESQAPESEKAEPTDDSDLIDTNSSNAFDFNAVLPYLIIGDINPIIFDFTKKRLDAKLDKMNIQFFSEKIKFDAGSGFIDTINLMKMTFTSDDGVIEKREDGHYSAENNIFVSFDREIIITMLNSNILRIIKKTN